MSDESSPASAIGSPVIAVVRRQVPEFEDAFRRELDTEGTEMGAFEAMSLFAGWLAERIDASPEAPEVQRAFRVVEEVASSSDYPMGRALVTEFVEALWDNPGAVALMGPKTIRAD